MRHLFVAASLLLCPLAPAVAQISVEIELQGSNLGFDQPAYPELVAVPGYPVYYAPGSASNYFFYDGMFWVFQGDTWYASSWYNGPWGVVQPGFVPFFILRVPVRYYRRPPVYFQAWQHDAPPRWGEHWGSGWERQHSGWERWDRRQVPAPAPLPVYQRQYVGDRYPQRPQQRDLRQRNYQHAPADAAVRRVYQAQGRGGPTAQQPRAEPARQQQPRAEPPRQQPPRAEPPRQQQPRAELPKQQQPRAEPPKQQQPRAEPPRQQQPRAEPPRQQQPRAEPAHQEPQRGGPER
jgi:hypothetical protein